LFIQPEDEMNRIESPHRADEFANQSDVSRSDAAALPSITGRDASSIVPSDAAKPVGAHPRSEVTGRHDAGSGANETVDGLTSTEEAVRRGAEDVPIGAPEADLEDLPVFDRGDALPKV
jgi:hypothetical protein